MACGFIVPQPGIKTKSPAMEDWNLNYWMAREVPHPHSLKKKLLFIKFFLFWSTGYHIFSTDVWLTRFFKEHVENLPLQKCSTFKTKKLHIIKLWLPLKAQRQKLIKLFNSQLCFLLISCLLHQSCQVKN